ncbi:MAG TPA: hypothetical protein VGN00_16245 [Puia sp.]|jgi:hypothetical protein
MSFFFVHPFKRKQRDEQALVPLHEVPDNSSEGGEFLDDAIRMEDLSSTRTEETVAAGSPGILV